MRFITKTHLTTAILAAGLALPLAGWAPASFAASAADQDTAKPAEQIANAADTGKQSLQDKVEQRIADMHETLHITAAQDAQFEKFADVMRGNAEQMDVTLTSLSGKAATATAVASLQSYAAIAQQHAQDVQKLSTAFQELYGSLTPEQQKDADEMFRAAAMKHEHAEGKKSG
jgi:uncharacterized membrane protein